MDEKDPGASEVSSEQPPTEIRSNPKGRERASQPPRQATSTEHMLIPSQVLSFVKNSPLINNVNVQEVGSENNWTTPITSYLKNGMLPNGKEAARKLKVQAARSC